MAFTPSSTIQAPVTKPAGPIVVNEGVATLFAALLLTVIAAQKTKKQLNKLKRRAIAELFKHRVKAGFARVRSLFSKKAPAIDNRTLLYILIGLAVLILIFIEPIIALVLLLIGILLYLLTNT